jgi:DNA-binding transcriptional LysR family regulator
MDVHGRDLRYFVAVAEDLHFTRAAERLFISQPALSKQIRMLERQLGAPLFLRGSDGVRLTPVGEALLPHAREWCWRPGTAVRAAAEEAKRGQAATLVAGMSTSPGRGGLVAAIRSRFSDLQPAATVELRQASCGRRAGAGGRRGSGPRSPVRRRRTRRWRTRDDSRPLVRDYARASRQASRR